MNIKFPVCGEPVYLNSPLADIEFCRDLTVQQPFSGKADNFPLACCQTPEPGFPFSFINRVLAAVTVLLNRPGNCREKPVRLHGLLKEFFSTRPDRENCGVDIPVPGEKDDRERELLPKFRTC